MIIKDGVQILIADLVLVVRGILVKELDPHGIEGANHRSLKARRLNVPVIESPLSVDGRVVSLICCVSREIVHSEAADPCVSHVSYGVWIHDPLGEFRVGLRVRMRVLLLQSEYQNESYSDSEHDSHYYSDLDLPSAGGLDLLIESHHAALIYSPLGSMAVVERVVVIDVSMVFFDEASACLGIAASPELKGLGAAFHI